MTDRITALDIKFQIYEDFGDGFSEENSYYLVDIKKHGPNMLLSIPIKENTRSLRVDPGDMPIRFYVNHIYLGDTEVTDNLISNRYILHGSQSLKHLLLLHQGL